MTLTTDLFADEITRTMREIERLAEPRWGKWCYVEVSPQGSLYRATLYARDGVRLDAALSNTEEGSVYGLERFVRAELLDFPDHLTHAIYDLIAEWSDRYDFSCYDPRVGLARQIRELVKEGVA